MNVFQRLYNYRELLKTNVQKEIRGRYKNSILGVMWSFLNPLLQLVVYSIIFGNLLAPPDDTTYHIYICVALIPWTFFTTVISQAAFTIIANGNILKKVFFPREILPISVVTSGAVNFFISTIIILILVALSGIGFTKLILFYPLIFFIQYLLLIGISFIVSSITVYVRDLEHIIGIILMVGFYATPIVYKIEDLKSPFLQTCMQFNPMTHLIDAYRAIFYYQTMPDLKMLGIMLAISIVLTIVGYIVFKKLQKGFAEEL